MDQEQEWILRARAGDVEAFTKLVEAYQTPVYNLAYRMLGNSVEAEDAAQETFIRRRRMTLLSLEDVAFTGHLASDVYRPEETVVRDEKEGMVRKLLDKLPEDYRAAVVLRYWYDCSYKEIAHMLDTTESAVKSRLFRARQMMARAACETVPELNPSLAVAA